MAGVQAWNSLPPETRTCSSLLKFRRETKSHLFRQSYGWLVTVHSDRQRTSVLSCATVLDRDLKQWSNNRLSKFILVLVFVSPLSIFEMCTCEYCIGCSRKCEAAGVLIAVINNNYRTCCTLSLAPHAPSLQSSVVSRGLVVNWSARVVHMFIYIRWWT